MNDLETILGVLSAPDLQNLAKSLKLNIKNQQKKLVVEAIVKHSKQKHIGAFFKQAAKTGDVILKRQKEKLCSSVI